MNGNYPPNVTGYEPQICGTGFEDKCESCLEDMDPRRAPEGVVEMHGILLCEDCLKHNLKEAGFKFNDLRAYFEREFFRKIKREIK